MSKINPVFSYRLRKALKLKKITQARLSEMIDVGVAGINFYCMGKQEPTVCNLRKICKALGVSADWLIGITDEDELLEVAEKLQRIEELQNEIDKIKGELQ